MRVVVISMQISSRSGSSRRTRDHDGAEERCSEDDLHKQTGKFRPVETAPFHGNRNRVLSDMQHLDPNQYGEADGREVDPPIQVETATWSKAGQLDWW
jgi:hypothetical protein